jgi:hypothetical protein
MQISISIWLLLLLLLLHAGNMIKAAVVPVRVCM